MPLQSEHLLEREPFLASLARDLAAAAGGAGRTVLVSGEAGIGKTSLLEAFRRAAPDARMLWGACEALFTPHPLGPLHDVARHARGRLAARLNDGSERPEVFAAMQDELALPPTPVVLVIEDVHWADAATLDLVRFVGRRIQQVPALLVLTYRDDELPPHHPLRAILGTLPARHVTRLSLPRLSPAAVAGLATAAARSDQGLYEVTGGNPFFVTEALASPQPGVPPTVRDAVLGRASILDPGARELLEFASIVPRAVETSLVADVLAPVPAAMDACLASGLLVADGRTLRFRHELARVAIEESLPRPRAQRWHALALAALSAKSGAVSRARLVHHAQSADDGDAVLRLAPGAAAEAASRGALREAAAHCRSALAFADALPDAQVAGLLAAYAGYCFELNDLAAAIPARERAIELFGKAGDLVQQCEAIAAQAMPLVRALRNADADAASRRAIALAESLPPGRHLARAYATEAYLRMLNRDYAEAIARGEQAIALAARHDDPDVLAGAYNCVGAALLFVDYARGCDYVRKSLALARDLPDGGVRVADAYVMLGSGSGELYEFATARRYLAEGIAFARTKDLDRLASYLEAWQALLQVHEGHWEAAGDEATAVLAREPSGSTSRIMALVALGRLRVRRGDPGAGDVLDEALALATTSGTLQRIAPVRCSRAEAAWLAGDLRGVLAEADAAFALACTKGHPWFVGELAYWRWRASAAGDPPAGCAEPYALEMAGRWAEAAAAWAAIGAPYEQARALAEGDEPAQRSALAMLDTLGAAPLAEYVRRRMRAAGVPAVPRGRLPSTRGHPAGLTRREGAILELLALGLRNGEIARRLSRSPRTVEHHIAAILAKLGAATRAEAVAVARARGLLAENMGTAPRQIG